MNDAREYAQRIADALVDVIESARWDARIGSIRALASRAGMTHTALNKRMNHETPFNVRDLAAIASVVAVSPSELLRRAKATVDGEAEAGDNITHMQGRPAPYSMEGSEEAARDEDKERGGE